MRWAIYYGDGTRFTDRDGPPADAPPWDVQVVAFESDAVGRRFVRQADFYIFRQGEWWGCDFAGLIDCLAHFPGCVVRFARTAPDDVYQRALDHATDDPYLPTKSARHGRLE